MYCGILIAFKFFHFCMVCRCTFGVFLFRARWTEVVAKLFAEDGGLPYLWSLVHPMQTAIRYWNKICAVLHSKKTKVSKPIPPYCMLLMPVHKKHKSKLAYSIKWDSPKMLPHNSFYFINNDVFLRNVIIMIPELFFSSRYLAKFSTFCKLVPLRVNYTYLKHYKIQFYVSCGYLLMSVVLISMYRPCECCFVMRCNVKNL